MTEGTEITQITHDYERALEVAVAAAREAGAVLRDELHRPGGPRGGYGHAEADDVAEGLIRDRIEAAFADHGICGEELPTRDRPPRDEAGHLWLLDPNDGTSSYLRGHRGSAVSIGLLRDGVPVLGVVYAFAAPDDDGDLLAWAEGCGPLRRNDQPCPPRWRGILDEGATVLVSQHADRNTQANAALCKPARFRAMPSIAYRLALAAAGEGEAAISLNGPCAWDFAGGHALLRGAAGELFDGAGAPITYTREGHTRAGDCFGGSAAAAHELALRDRRSVLRRAPSAPREPTLFGTLEPVLGNGVVGAAVLRRAHGCLLGQLAGDALGSLVEFRGRASIAAAYPEGLRHLADGGTWGTIAGQPTDDSELALMLARTLVASGFDEDAIAASYAAWYDSLPFDIGSTTSQALSAASGAAERGAPVAAAARAAASRDSQANGALMRISPLGIFGWRLPPGRLAALARADAALTHPHPVCADASAVFAVAIAHAVAHPEEMGAAVYEAAVAWAVGAALHADVLETLEAAAAGPPDSFTPHEGWVRIALHNAFARLLHAPSLEAGVMDTVMGGGDTDTNAAIAGALLGAVHGREAVPLRWRDRVLTCRPLRGLQGVRRPRPRAFWPVEAVLLAERLLQAGGEADGDS